MQKYISFFLGAFLLLTTTSVMAFDPPTKKKTLKQSLGYELSSSVYKNAVYQSKDNKQVYIDFNDIPVNIKCVQVMDVNGKVLVKKDVFAMPVNSLYEINLSSFPASNLVLEIQTFTDSRFIQLGGFN